MATAADGGGPTIDRFGALFGAVLASARQRDPWAFRQLFDAYGGAVAAYGRVQRVADPEGLANESFLRVFGAIERFTGDEAAFRSWLFTIAHHLVVDERRRLARRVVEVGADLDAVRGTAPGADLVAIANIGEERVRAVLGRLSPDQRDVLLLRVVGDLTAEQTARTVGKSVGAVKQLQRRGLEALRRMLVRPGARR